MKTKTFAKLLLLLQAACLIISTGCHKNDSSKPSNQCDTTNTTFSKLYTSVVNAANNFDDTTYDIQLHSYTFEVSSKETICKIGYQNLGIGNTQPDMIEIYDSTTNRSLYKGSHVFDSSKISYVSINPIALEIGHSYTISRVRNYITYTQELIGRIVRSRNRQLSLPVAFGDLKITHTSFGIPYIDLVFE